MSGHSGFQPIGNNLPPIIPQPQVGDVRGPGQAPQSQPPAVSGGDVPARDYNVRKEAAEALSRKLDTLQSRISWDKKYNIQFNPEYKA